MDRNTGPLAGRDATAAAAAARQQALRARTQPLPSAAPVAASGPQRGSGFLTDANSTSAEAALARTGKGPEALDLARLIESIDLGVAASAGVTDVAQATGDIGVVRANVANASGQVASAIGRLQAQERLSPEQQRQLQTLQARKLQLDAAANLLAVGTGIATAGEGYRAFQNGDVAGGLAGMAEGGLDVVGRGGRAFTDIRQLTGASSAQVGSQVRVASAFVAASDLAGGVRNIAGGLDRLRDGELLEGGIQLASGTASTVSGATQTAAQVAALGRGGTMLARMGRVAPGAVAFAGALGAVDAFSRSAQAFRDGRILEGVATGTTGALGTLTSASATANSLARLTVNGTRLVAEGSRLANFGAMASRFGGGAAIVGGGFQAYNALSGEPPDMRAAAVGTANMVGGALLLAGPPAALAGGAILIGTALYENVAPVREVVDGVVGSVGELAEGVADGARAIGEGLSDAAADLRRGDVAGAAGELAEGVAEAGRELARGLDEGVDRAAAGVREAGRSIARGAESAATAVASTARSAGRVVARNVTRVVENVRATANTARREATRQVVRAAVAAGRVTRTIARNVTQAADTARQAVSSVRRSVTQGVSNAGRALGNFVSSL